MTVAKRATKSTPQRAAPAKTASKSAPKTAGKSASKAASKTGSASSRSASKTAASPASRTSATGVLKVLKKDHQEVKKMFEAYQKLADADASAEERLELSEQICTALTRHAMLEEELFYPAVREGAPDAQDTLDEAEVEHASVKSLIAQIQSMNPDDDLYNAKVKVLGEYVDHHVQEEESEIFRMAKKARLDLEDLGEQFTARMEASHVTLS